MFILRTTARDWKGLGDITVDWVDHNNLIGENEAGKTALLETVIDTFNKIDSREIPQPINNKRGATTAEYEHEFTIDGKTTVLKISRMYRANGRNALSIEPDPPEGMTNAMLLKMLWPQATKLDVAELKRRKVDEWLADVLDMMGIKSQLNELDRLDSKLRDERRDAGRDKDKAIAQVPVTRPEKVEAVNVDEINDKLKIAQDAKHNYDHHYSEWNYCQDNISKKEALIAQMKKEIRQLEIEAEGHYNKYEEYEDSANTVDTLVAQLSDAANTNSAAEAYIRYDEYVADAKNQKMAHADLDAQVKAIPAKKRALFTDNECPVEHVNVDDDGVLTYKSVPIQQINEGARMLLGAQILINKLSNQTVTMEDGTEIDSLKLLMVENGSQADTNTRAKIRDMCDKAGVQTIFELVIGERWDDEKDCLVPDYDTADKMGIVIEEGEIHNK